jgi:hypothetical protein
MSPSFGDRVISALRRFFIESFFSIVLSHSRCIVVLSSYRVARKIVVYARRSSKIAAQSLRCNEHT